MKPQAYIESWSVAGNCLVGTIKDHPYQEDFKSTMQVTSPLISIDYKAGVAETQNTNYILGVSLSERIINGREFV